MVVNNRPYGMSHDYPTVNLPPEPQDPSFLPSRDDVVIKPDVPHNHINPSPTLLTHEL